LASKPRPCHRATVMAIPTTNNVPKMSPLQRASQSGRKISKFARRSGVAVVQTQSGFGGVPYCPGRTPAPEDEPSDRDADSDHCCAR
jgi:hypothetical protein